MLCNVYKYKYTKNQDNEMGGFLLNFILSGNTEIHNIIIKLFSVGVSLLERFIYFMTNLSFYFINHIKIGEINKQINCMIIHVFNISINLTQHEGIDFQMFLLLQNW